MVPIFSITLFSERFPIIGNFTVSPSSREENKGSKAVTPTSATKLDGIALIHLPETIITIIVNTTSKNYFVRALFRLK